MKKTQRKDLLAGCSLAGKKFLRQVITFYLAFVMMLGAAAPVSASEIIPPVTESTPTEAADSPTEAVDTPTEALPNPTGEPDGALQEEASSEVQNTLAEDLRSDIEEYIERYQLSVGMTTEELANAYFVLDADGARAAWETLNDFLKRSEGLTGGESAAIWAEENTKLCSRFYNIMMQINGPVFVATDEYPLTDIRVNTVSSATASLKDGTLTIQFGSTGCGSNSESTTITIYNETGIDIDLTFKLSVTDGSVNIGTDGNGIATMSIASGKSQAITLTNTAGKKATLKLSDFNFEESSSNTRNITFIYGSGDVTVDNESVGGSGDTVPISLAGATIKITDPNFFGWINTETNTLITQLAEYTLEPASDMTIKAIYNTSPIFIIGGTTEKTAKTGFMDLGKLTYHTVSGSLYFDDLNEAASAAEASSTSKVVVLINDATLSAGNYTIPAGVTLLIPFDDENSLFTTEVPDTGEDYSTPTAYRTLTMAKDAKIIVNGSVSVSAKHRTTNGAKTDGGSPTSSAGFVNMEIGSNITVNNGGNLYAYGFITGSGTVIAKSGSKVYENIQIMDFRGGTQTTKGEMTTKKLFPLSQYYIQNIEVPITFEYNATEYAYTTIDMSGGSFSAMPQIFGSSGALFNITEGKATKWYDGNRDRFVLELEGALEVASLKMTFYTTTINSSDYVLAINNNIDFNIKSGSTVTIANDVALQPGAIVNIEKDATLKLGSGVNLYVYDSDNWGTYCGATNKEIIPLNYAPGKNFTRTTDNLEDASIRVDGTLDASVGYLYTTNSGAKIYSTGTGVAKINTADTNRAADFKDESGNPVTYQLIQDSAFVPIPVISSPLTNRDGSFKFTAGTSAATTYNYDSESGKWHLAGCTPTSEVTLPTHTQTGSVTSGCDCYGETNETIDKVVMLTAIGASAADEVILDQKFLLPQELIADANATVTVVKQKKVAGITDRKIYSLADITADSADTGAYIDSSGRYVISRGIASGEMTRDVTVQFQYGDGTTARVRSGNTMADVQNTVARNVRDYADLALTAGNDGQKALITALLTYGGHAQLAFGVDADKPVYDLLTEKDLAIPSIDNVSFTQEVTTSGASIGITQDKQQAFLDSAIYLRVYFKLDEGASIGDYTFEQGFPIANKDAYQIQLEPGYDAAKGKHYVDIRDIPAAYLDYPYTITVKKGNDSYIVKTSVLAYLTNLIASDRTDIEADKNLAKAMYLYNQAANTYFDR